MKTQLLKMYLVLFVTALKSGRESATEAEFLFHPELPKSVLSQHLLITIVTNG